MPPFTFWLLVLVEWFVLGLAAHMFVGNSWEVVVHDLHQALKTLVASGCLLLACLLITIAVYLLRNRDVYERNRHATLVNRAVLQGTATDVERSQHQIYLQQGVLTYNSHGVLRLSDESVRQLFS